MTATIFRRWRWAVAGLVATSVALGTLVQAQPPAAKSRSAAARNKAKTGKNAAGPRRKAPPNAADPLGQQVKAQAADQGKAAEPGTYHFQLKITGFDDVPFSATYYPAAKQDTTAAVVLLVHEKERSSKDFEDPIADLKNQGLAEHLQKQGYAVMAFDLRGHGANPRRALTEREWRELVDDLQSVYQFLVDRHNRGEINIAKLGVVALGEGANLAAAWAYQPGAAVSSEGRVTDLSGMALISPLGDGAGYPFSTVMNALSTRIPVLLMTGERDVPSHDAVKRVRGNVEKTRQNKVELFPSSLHGYKLLRLEPRAGSSLVRFLDGTVKLRASEWEPRYNLTPVSYSDIKVVRHTRLADAEKAEEKAKPEEKAKAKDEEKAKEAPKPEEKAREAR
ncbi:MAG: alpha/beta hydrolase [Isosphaeraceae bacterium]